MADSEAAKPGFIPTTSYIGQSRALIEAALSLSENVTIKAGSFLGSEVKEKSSIEEKYEDAWKALGAGDMAKTIELAGEMLVVDRHFEKVYFTRAIAYARTGEWRHAAADYSTYLKLTQATSGAPLANALYGRALCMAKMGHRLQALRDLKECIRVGPVDEQLGDKDISLVPQAVIAKLALLQAYPELAGVEQAQAQAQQKASVAADAQAEASQAAAADDEPKYEGALWRVPVTAMDEAMGKAREAGKTPLLLDPTEQKVTDKYFLYAPATVVEAKKMVVDIRMGGGKIEDAREQLRGELVHAMRYGHYLVVRMANSAADFVGTYCADDSFPVGLFEQPKVPAGRDAAKDAAFSKVLRPADIKVSHGMLNVPTAFQVVITSTFKADNYEKLLKASLPLAHIQPIAIFEPSAKARAKALAGEGATNNGPLSGVLADWGGAWNSTASRSKGDKPKAGQLQGDRMSLYLSN